MERLFRTTKDMIYTTVSSTGREWPDVLPLIERALRCTKHSSTGFTPYEIIFGRSMPNVWIAVDNVKHKQKPQTEYIREIINHVKMVEEQMEK